MTVQPASIVLADDGVPFDGRSLEAGPLGGAETAFIGLAEALAARGHRVQAFTSGTRWLDHNGVRWTPIADGLPDQADLYIANRGHRLLSRVKGAKRTVFWLHNPAQYLLKPRYLWPLWRRRPTVVFLGPSHAGTLPAWVPAGPRVIIPYGISETFLHAERRSPPRPHAVFTSNPLRRLDWVIERWTSEIAPALPMAELHVYSSLTTYGGGSPEKEAQSARVLRLAREAQGHGVVLHPPLAKAALARELTEARILLYGGDPGETFCLAVAEAQAMGVPAVVCRSTCLAERVIDGTTGFVVEDEDGAGFARHALALLTDDALWQRQHEACLETQRARSWDVAAAEWESLLP